MAKTKKATQRVSLRFCHQRHWGLLKTVSVGMQFSRSYLAGMAVQGREKWYKTHSGEYSSAGNYARCLIDLGCIVRDRSGVYRKILPNEEIERRVADRIGVGTVLTAQPETRVQPETQTVDLNALAENLVRQFAAQNHSLRSRVEDLEQQVLEVSADLKQEVEKFKILEENYRRAQEKINELNQEKASREEKRFVPLERIQAIYKEIDANEK